MSVVKLNDFQWEKILSFLKTCQNIYIGQESACRNFLEAVLWITRSGSQWRLLPDTYGNWYTIYKRACQMERTWCLWKTFWAFFFRPRSWISADWFNHCAFACLCCRSQKKHGEQSLGRSRGGFSTKIHLATDALGNAIRFILTGGQRNDITQAEQLLENLFPDYVIADKGYDSDKFVLLLKKRNSEAVIPSRVNRKIQRVIDTDLYKERHLIECCIGKLKHFRRVFSRFDKLAKSYLSFVQFASTIVWLR